MKLIQLAIISATLLGILYYYPDLPAMVPSHWNFRNEIDGYMPKTSFALFMPGMIIGMWLLFQIMPKLDPKRDKYVLFEREWSIMQTAIMGFFAYLNFAIIHITRNPGRDLTPFMFGGLGVLFILLGNYMSKIRQNYFIGIKVPWTLSSEENWNKTHRFASWTFVLAGMVTLIEAFVLWYAPVIVLGGLVLAGALPVLYSYLIHIGKPNLMKYVFLVLALGITIMVFVRSISPEDTWLCEQGVWIKHGQPASPAPTSPCP